MLHNTSDKIPAPVQLEEERRKLEENNQKQKDPINQEPIPTTRREGLTDLSKTIKNQKKNHNIIIPHII